MFPWLKIFFFLVAITFFCAGNAASECIFTAGAADPGNTGFGYAALGALKDTLAANGCAEAAQGAPGGFEIVLSIDSLDSDKKLNAKGLLLAGGLSSAVALEVTVEASISVTENGAPFHSEKITFRGIPHEIYSGWRRSHGTKKRAVEDAAIELAAGFLKKIKGGNKPVAMPKRGAGDFLGEDRDVWPFLGGGFTAIGIHEFGHQFNARLTGHDADFKGNDSRTFNAGPETVAGVSALFALHLNEDQLLPLLPDVTYDFHGVQTPSGMEYVDENGQPVSHGRRDHALLAYSGILFMNLSNEILLTRHPNLIDEDRPFLKGMFFSDIVIPAFYTFQGYADDNSDLLLLQRDLGYDRWAVNAIVLVPAALDLYRYYHPEKKRLRTYARIAKAVPVIICLTK